MSMEKGMEQDKRMKGGVEEENMISISRGMSCNQNSKELGKGFEKMVTIT